MCIRDRVEDAIMQIKDFPHVHIKGLMTIAPFVDNPEENRGIFKKLFEFAVDIGGKNIDKMCIRDRLQDVCGQHGASP